jgi:hypothetical protein
MCQPWCVCVAVSTARFLSAHSLGGIAYYSLLAFAVYQQRVMRLSSCRVLATCQAVPLSCLCGTGWLQHPGLPHYTLVNHSLCKGLCLVLLLLLLHVVSALAKLRAQADMQLAGHVCVCTCLAQRSLCVVCLLVCRVLQPCALPSQVLCARGGVRASAVAVA